MVHTVKVKREDIPKELQMLLENGKDSNGEEVFSHMPEDLIYLAALVDMQSSMLHLLMLFIAEKQPVEPLRIVPFDKLCKLVTHEIEFLAGMRDLIRKKRAQIIELIVIIARHFINERAFAVHDFVVAERQDKVLRIGICHGER